MRWRIWACVQGRSVLRGEPRSKQPIPRHSPYARTDAHRQHSPSNDDDHQRCPLSMSPSSSRACSSRSVLALACALLSLTALTGVQQFLMVQVAGAFPASLHPRPPQLTDPRIGHAMCRELHGPKSQQPCPVRTADMADSPDVPYVFYLPLARHSPTNSLPN